MPAFSLDYALTQHHKLRESFTRYRNRCRANWLAYAQNHWTSLAAEGDYQATLPIESLVVDTALAMITSADPIISVPPRGDSERQGDDADRVERWHLGVDYLNFIHEGADPRHTALFNSLLYGLGWMREVADFPHDWLDDPDPGRLHYAFPISQVSLHPSQIAFRRGRSPGGITTLSYEADYTVADVESEWDKRLQAPRDDKGRYLPKDPYEVRRVVDFWEWRQRLGDPVLYHGVFTVSTDEWVKAPVPMDEYRRIPYHPIPCYQTGEEKPEDRYLSLLFKLQELPHLAEIVLSRILRMAEMYIDPMILAKSSTGKDIEIEKAPGAIIDIGPEDDVRYLSYSGTPPELQRALDTLLQLGYLAGFAPSVYSQGQGDSALARAADVEQALFKITSPTRFYKRGLEEVYWHRAMLMHAFSPTAPVPVSGEDRIGRVFSASLNGNQLARHAQVNVRIRPGLYTRLLADINVATQAVNAKLWSLDEAMDFLGVQDRGRVREAIMRDQREFHPSVIEMEAQLYAKDLQEALAGEGAPGANGGGMAGGPPGLPPGGPLGLPPGGPSGLPPVPNQPAVQGVENSLRTLGGGAMAGAAANPTNPASITAERLRRMARGGRPVNAPTTG